MCIIHSHLASSGHSVPQEEMPPGPLPAAATAILGHTSKHGHFPLGTRASPEGGWGGTQRSGLREGTGRGHSSGDSATSPGQQFSITSISSCELGHPLGEPALRSRHKEGDFSLFLAWELGAEH